MEWLIMGGGLSATATNLGYQEDSKYVITEECQDVLEQLLNNIQQESKVNCQARRSIASSRLIQMDLIPILCHAGDDIDVFDAVIRLLMHLSMPLEVFMPIVKKLTNEDYQKRHELQKMLETIKKEFTQPQVLSALVGQMALIIEEAGSYPIDKFNAETLSNCLTLLRNILYVNYERYKVGSLKNDTIIANLFKAGFHDVLRDMCRRAEGAKWLSSFLQVLHLMYKDTSANKMVKYLLKKHNASQTSADGPKTEDDKEVASGRRMEEAAVDEKKSSQAQTQANQEAESSDGKTILDDASRLLEGVSLISNTPSPASMVSDDSQSSTSSTSAASSNDSSRTLSRSGSPSEDSEDSTIQGSTTTQTSISSTTSESSEENADVNNMWNLKRKNMRNLAEFALDYTKHGMDNILVQCKDELRSMVVNHYFLWQLNFFLPFTTLPQVSYVDVKLTLSAPVFSQLLSCCMKTWEEFMQASMQRNDSKSNSIFKILTMQVTTLRQMLNSIQKFSTNPQSTDLIQMKTVLATIALTKTVRNFYHLLIRKFQPHLQTLEFLREIIVGNDLVLRIIDQVQHIHRPDWGKLDMIEHVKKFASRPIMLIYNYMLSKFCHNSREENEVVLTMFHHVSVDIKMIEVLYQIPILSTFASLWEEGCTNISRDSQDLIDYIIQEFCILGRSDKDKCLKTVTMIDDPRPHKRDHSPEGDNDVKKQKTVDALLAENPKGIFIAGSESDVDDEDDDEEVVRRPEVVEHEKVKPVEEMSVAECLEVLQQKGYRQEIMEVQEVLLEICYLKLNCSKVHIGEPHIWHCCSDEKSVPIVAFTEKAELVQSDSHFKTLLHKLGLHTSQDTGRLYPSIPAFWTSDMCYKAACSLGEVLPDSIKFDVDEMKRLPQESREVTGMTRDMMLDLKDLDLESDKNTSTLSAIYFQVPERLWCNVIKKANMAKVN